MDADKYREAAEEYHKASDAGEIDANNATAWYGWGVALWGVEDYHGAIEKLDKARRIDPRWASPCVTLGSAFAGLKQYDRAIENFRKAAELNPNTPATHVNWGNALFRQRRYAEAVEQYTKAANIEKGNSAAWLWKMKALRALKRFEEAETAGREAIEALPGRTDILQELADVYFDRADYRRGVETIDKAIRMEPQDAKRGQELWKAKLAGLREATDPLLVEQTVAQVEKEFAGDAEMLLEAGRLRKSQGQFEKALDLFDRAFEIGQGAATLVEKGYACFDWGRMEQAIEQFDRALRLDEHNVGASQWKIASLQKRRRLDEAERLVDRLLEAGSPLAREGALLNERAWLRVQQTRFEEAIEAFRATLQIHPDDADALAGILSCHRLRRDFRAADRFWKEEVAGHGIDQSGSLFAERCQLFIDQRLYDAGIEYCRQRPGTDRDALDKELTFLRMLRRFDDAEKKAGEALAHFPGNLSFLTHVASIHLERRRYTQASLGFELVLKIRPNHEGALLGKVNSLYSQGPEQFDAAEGAILEGLRRLPENPALRTQLGQIHYDRGRFREAEECLSKAISFATPEYLTADFLRLDVLEQLKRGDEAGVAAAALVRTRPNDLEARSPIGWFYLGRNDSIAARNEFDFIHSLDPKHLLGINGLGGVAFTQGDFRSAADFFAAAGEIDPNEPVFLTNLAWAMVRQAEPRPVAQQEEFSEAAARCRAALALDPRSVEAYTCLGAIAFKRGRILESEDYLRTSIRMSARRGGYVDLGALYVHMGKYDEAETNLKKVVEASRSDSSARIELGNLYLLTGREREGIRLFREAADIDPFNPEPPRALALALQGQGNFREAEQVLRKAIQKLDKPRRWQLHLTLAQLLTELGDKSEDASLFEDALAEITTVITLKPLNPDAHFRAGIIRHRLEDYPLAVKRFRECLALNPDHIDATRNVRIVRALIREQRLRGRSAFWLGLALGVFCLAGTLGMWYLYLPKDSKITSGMITGLTPTLIAFAAAAFLFPYLVHLKLPGVEAELSQPVEKISKGPMGGIGK